MIDEATTRDKLSPDTAAILAGKANFLASSMYGKVGRAALKAVYARQHQTEVAARAGNKITTQLRRALAALRHFILAAPPRTLSLGKKACRMLVYTDAFFTPKTDNKEAENGWGCVLVTPDYTEYAMGTLPHQIVRQFSPTKAYIYFLECIAGILPLHLWHQLTGDYIQFIDNEAAKHALVKGYSAVEPVNFLIDDYWQTCAARQCRPWLMRVTSAANPADDFSRQRIPSCAATWRRVQLADRFWSDLIIRFTTNGGRRPADDREN